MFEKFLTIISSNIFLGPFSLSSPSGTPIIQMFVHLMLCQRSLRLSSILFIFFSLFCSVVVFATILSSRSLIHSSASVILLLIPSREFLISLICVSSLFVCSWVLLGPCKTFLVFLADWVFVAARGLSLVAVSRDYSSLQCAGSSLRWLLLLRSMGSRRAGFSSCGTQAQ